jgi:phosphodiesterase/alkaline phosphatase D-like protein
MKNTLLLSTSWLSASSNGNSVLRAAQAIDLGADKQNITVAFGSCYGLYDFKSDIFKTIAAAEPDLFVWLGDVSYNDSPDLKFKGMSPEYVAKRLA